MLKVIYTSRALKALQICVCAIGTLLYLSPYKYHDDAGQKMVLTEMIIDVSPELLFRYLGDSNNASSWSTFVACIEPLNEECVLDGNVGSQRRCFGNKETIIWDEEITEGQINSKRQLSISNAEGFIMMADHLLTEQYYVELSENKTKLGLSLFFDKKGGGFIDQLKMYVAAYFVADIFKANLRNIKELNEDATL